MLLNRIKLLLGINDTESEELIDEILNITTSKVLNYIKADTVPTSLEFVLVELTIQRFNRIGSEGVETETVDGRQTTYIADEFEAYKHYLDAYLNANAKNRAWKLL
ncbi:MAG: phage head-tail connector protein [Cetobacterium sp.]